MHVFTIGFVTLLIIGVASKILPVFEGSDIRWPRLMDIAFVLVNTSVVLRVAGGFSTSTPPGPPGGGRRTTSRAVGGRY